MVDGSRMTWESRIEIQTGFAELSKPSSNTPEGSGNHHMHNAVARSKGKYRAPEISGGANEEKVKAARTADWLCVLHPTNDNGIVARETLSEESLPKPR
jgi:hypothetical protein